MSTTCAPPKAPPTTPINVTVGEIVRREDGTVETSASAGGLDWRLVRFPDANEDRIRDIELAERLGFEQPRMIRKIIARHVAAENISPFHRSTVERWNTGRKGAQLQERTVTEYWLTLEEALFVTTQSETKRAVLVTKLMIAVFAAVLRGELNVSATRAANPEMANMVATLVAISKQFEVTREELAATRQHVAQLERSSLLARPQLVTKLKSRINRAAKLMNDAMPRARGSWRMTIEDMVRQDVRYPRSAKHTLDAMPSAQLERALVVADQRVHEAERMTRSVRQPDLPGTKRDKKPPRSRE